MQTLAHLLSTSGAFRRHEYLFQCDYFYRVERCIRVQIPTYCCISYGLRFPGRVLTSSLCAWKIFATEKNPISRNQSTCLFAKEDKLPSDVFRVRQSKVCVAFAGSCDLGNSVIKMIRTFPKLVSLLFYVTNDVTISSKRFSKRAHPRVFNTGLTVSVYFLEAEILKFAILSSTEYQEVCKKSGTLFLTT